MSRGSRARDLDYNRDDRRSRPSDNDLAARIFIGGLNTKNLSHRELVDWMNRYGKVLDVAIFDRHVLVQFDRESEGRRAIDREKGQSYRGSRFDIRFASSSDGSIGSRPEVSRSRSPRSTMPYDRDPRDISPPYRDAIRDRSPIDRERERYFKERHTSPDYRRYERPRSNMEDGRVPANPANIRPDFQEPNWNVQPFTNQLTTERPGFDAAIIVMSSELLTYAETIEARLQRQIALTTHIIVLKEESHANACVEDLTNKGVLYAFLVNGMNEKHFSCSLRILYGNPQEHRNMPLNSALTFVAQNFESYQKRVRELKSIAPKPTFDPSRMPPGFIAPDDKIIYLLHLLADSRMLTIEELNDVIDFVQKRIKALAQAEGLIDKTNPMTNFANEPLGGIKNPINVAASVRDEKSFIAQQNQLHSKILNILKPPPGVTSIAGGGDSLSSSNIPNIVGNDHPYGSYNEPPQSANSKTVVGGGSSNILTNPTVQQALDNLMQSKFRSNNPSEQIEEGIPQRNNSVSNNPPMNSYSANMNRPLLTNPISQQQQRPITQQPPSGPNVPPFGTNYNSFYPSPLGQPIYRGGRPSYQRPPYSGY